MFSLDQYEAARHRAVVFESDWQGVIRLSGKDRASFLHSLLTNDIANLAPGTGVYAAYLTPQGRMISDMRVFETGGEILLQVERLVASQLAGRLDKLLFSEDVQISDVTESMAQVSVLGPLAMDVIRQATNLENVAGLRTTYDNVSADDKSLTAVLNDSWGFPRCDLFVARTEASSLVARLVEAGAVPASMETVEVLRVEAGQPRFGIDMTTDTIPLEAGLEDRAISFTKGCYVGQEVIIRVLHRGHGRVARRLVGLVLEDGPTPAAHDAISVNGGQVGEVTSAAESPLASKSIALGYVPRELATEGAEVVINGSLARVHLLPFKR